MHNYGTIGIASTWPSIGYGTMGCVYGIIWPPTHTHIDTCTYACIRSICKLYQKKTPRSIGSRDTELRPYHLNSQEESEEKKLRENEVFNCEIEWEGGVLEKPKQLSSDSEYSVHTLEEKPPKKTLT